ncbi:glycosyltransferase family 4 protein, partial [Candidatus Micrarchaeota archaeon]|nr:glycosyltransferase family 4 protein [Candidatus Micrarchaeota archaeon]
DIYHIHNRFWYFLGTLMAIKLIKKKKLFLTLHNARPQGISPLIDTGAGLYDDIWGHRIMEATDRIIAVSNDTLNTTVPKKLHHKARVVHNGVDIERFAPRSGKSIREKLGLKNEFVVISNARFVEQKGIPYLLTGFAMLKKDYKDAKLILIGKGPLKNDFVNICKKLKIEDSVIFVTGIPENELPLYYNASDLFILSSVWEPCALVLLEALASGLPIVATDIGGNPEIVNEDCGILVPARNPRAIYEQAKLLLDNPKLRRKLGDNARERAVKNFSWDIVASKMQSIYEEVVK